MLIEGPLLAAPQPETTSNESSALIGPHAVIHAVAVMQDHLGPHATKAVLRNAMLTGMPSGANMIPEIAALRLHRWLALREPVECFAIAGEAARLTADYIIANRIPAVAAWLLRILPASLSGPLLMQAIRHHAWTFVGAGQFRPSGAWEFVIDRTHANDPVMPPESLFHWYAGVFECLYQRLVSPHCRCLIEDTGPQALSSRRYRILTRPA